MLAAAAEDRPINLRLETEPSASRSDIVIAPLQSQHNCRIGTALNATELLHCLFN